MIESFSVHRRNFRHWDIFNSKGRLFRIRGEEGEFLVSDERQDADHSWKKFKTLSSCMSYICDELMFEIIDEGK